MNLIEIEKIVAGIQNHIFKNSNSYAIGMLKSHFKGAGLQFKEHQVYMPGDDVRFIDWKLSAKTNNMFVKTFEEERNVEIIAFVDITNTMFMGYKNISKLKASLELACLLYMLTEKTNDNVTTILFHNDITVLPPFSGRKGITALVSTLSRMGLLDEQGEIILHNKNEYALDEKRKLSVMRSYVARGKEVVYLGDLSEINDTESFNKILAHPNMHCFKICSPIDKASAMPFSVFGMQGKSKGKKFFRLKKEKSLELFKGKWKEILVSERYLEDFVRNML